MEATQNVVTPLSPRRRNRRKRVTKPARPRPLALGYIRVSSTEQIEAGASLDSQRAVLAGKAEVMGWDIEIIDGDAGISAKDITGRPALTTALARLAAGDADYLVAAALDRISRSVSDVSGLMSRSVEEEWGLVCLRESIDTSTAMGRAFVQIAAVFAELERGLVSERTKAGMAQKKLEGSVFGKPSKLDPAVRARITAQHAAGVSCTQIARGTSRRGCSDGSRRLLERRDRPLSRVGRRQGRLNPGFRGPGSLRFVASFPLRRFVGLLGRMAE